MGIEVASTSNFLYNGKPITDYSLGLKFTNNELNDSNKFYFNRTYYSQIPDPTLVGYNDVEDPYFINAIDLNYTNNQGSKIELSTVDVNWGNEPAVFNSSYKIDEHALTASSLRSTPIPVLYGVDNRLKQITISDIKTEKEYSIYKKENNYFISGTDVGENKINKNIILEIQAPGGDGGAGFRPESNDYNVTGGGGGAGGYMLLAIDIDNVTENKINIITNDKGVNIYCNDQRHHICNVGSGGDGGVRKFPEFTSIGYMYGSTYYPVTESLASIAEGKYVTVTDINNAFNVNLYSKKEKTADMVHSATPQKSLLYTYGDRGESIFYNTPGVTLLYSAKGQRGVRGNIVNLYKNKLDYIERGLSSSYLFAYEYPSGGGAISIASLTNLEESIYMYKENDSIQKSSYFITFFNDTLGTLFSKEIETAERKPSDGGKSVLGTGDGGKGLLSYLGDIYTFSEEDRRPIYGGTGTINIYYYPSDIEPNTLAYEIINASECRISGIGTYESKDVIIPSTIRSYNVVGIKENAFNNTDITSVEIPSSVRYINKGAFRNTEKLKSVTFKNNLDTLSEYVFYGCSALTSITIPNRVETIESNAFSGCTNLTSITLPSNLKTIGSNAFYECTSLKNIDIPDTVTDIGAMCFYGCSVLDNISLPDISIMKNGSFGRCSSLKNITIPASVESIETGVFSECFSLESITIPEGVTYLGNYVFESCSSLNSVVFNDPNNWWYSSYENATVGTLISSSELSNNNTAATHLTETYVNYYWKKTAQITSTFEYRENMHDPNAIDLIKITSGNENIIVNVPKNIDEKTVVGILGTCFTNCPNVKTVYIPNTIEYIERHAFNDVYYPGGHPDNFQAIFENSVGWEVSPSYNFEGTIIKIDSDDLKDPVTAGTYLTDTYYEYFWRRRDENQLDWKPIDNETCSITGIGTYSEEEIIIPETIKKYSVTSIDSGAFKSNTTIKKIQLPSSLLEIKNEAFYECQSLTTINLPENLTTIGIKSFYRCQSLTTINLPENLTTIGSSSFYGCALNSISIPKSLKTISDHAFALCKLLSTVTIPTDASLEEIKEYAFDNCSSISSVIIPNSVINIGKMAFSECSNLGSIVLSNSLTAIPNGMLFKCSKLESITIPESVTAIGFDAFADTGLTDAIFENKSKWAVKKNNDDVISANISNTDLDNSKTAATYLKDIYAPYYWIIMPADYSEFKYAVISDVDKTIKITKLISKNKKIVEIPPSIMVNGVAYSVTTIGRECIIDDNTNDNIESIYIPSSVIYIEPYGINGVTWVQSIVFETPAEWEVGTYLFNEIIATLSVETVSNPELMKEYILEDPYNYSQYYMRKK